MTNFSWPVPGRSRLRKLRWFLGYLAAQSFVVAGLVTSRYPDSAGYLQLSFTGKYERLWTVPLFYDLFGFGSDPIRVAAQVLFAAICWWILAAEASRIITHRHVRIGLRVVLLALGLVSPIAQFNSTILSDSVAISLSALLIAMWLRFVHAPSYRCGIGVAVVTLLWEMTRSDLVLLGLLVAIVFLVVTVVRYRRDALRIALALALVAISAYGFAIDGRNPTVADENIADIIDGRILPNPGWTQWWVRQGMPYSSAIQKTEGSIYGLALTEMPSFDSWLTADGARTYTYFLATHPGYTLWDALPDFTGELATLNHENQTAYPYTQPNPTPSMLSPTANYGRHRDIFPSVVETALFEQGQIGDVVALAALAFAAAYVARRRYGRDRRMGIPIAVVVATIPQGYLVWLFGGDGETDRHSIVLAATCRIGLWIMAAYAIDRLIRDRPSRSSPDTM